MDNLLEQNTNNALIELQEEIKIEYKKSLMYMFVFLNFIIPILSVEGIFSWSIGILGSYKIINIYRSTTEKNKTGKAAKCLIISWTIVIIYNIIVYYATKIITAKVV